MYNIENMDDVRDTLITVLASVGTEYAIGKLVDTSQMNLPQKIGMELMVALACTGAVKVGKMTANYISKKKLNTKEQEGVTDGRA